MLNRGVVSIPTATWCMLLSLLLTLPPPLPTPPPPLHTPLRLSPITQPPHRRRVVRGIPVALVESTTPFTAAAAPSPDSHPLHFHLPISLLLCLPLMSPHHHQISTTTTCKVVNI